MSDDTKTPFVPEEDRPDVKLSPDTPIGDLRVRDLVTILGASSGKHFDVGKTSLKDFFDKDWPEVAKDFMKEIKTEKVDKSEIKEFKGEKHEKIEKREKFEKTEIKEHKNEKLEQEGQFSSGLPGPDPRIEQLIQTVSGLTKQLVQLTNQVEELKKKTK